MIPERHQNRRLRSMLNFFTFGTRREMLRRHWRSYWQMHNYWTPERISQAWCIRRIEELMDVVQEIHAT